MKTKPFKRMIHRFRRPLLCLLLAGLGLSSAFSQEFKDLKFKDKLFLGGNFGLMFGTETYVNLSPVVGYRLTERLSAGLGPIYQYYSLKTIGERFKSHIYGGRGFASYTVIRDLNKVIPLGIPLAIFGHVEYEALNMERQLIDFPLSLDTGRFWLENVLVGGGFGQPVGQRSSFQIMILWNLNETAASLYQNPVVRFGFSF